MIEPIEKWTCTDPDTLQYGRQISDGVYEFREWKKEYCGGGVVGSVEFRTDPICWNDCKYWNEATINLSAYRYKGIDETVSSYGYVLLDNYLLDGYSLEDSKWLIAKCLFEEEFAEIKVPYPLGVHEFEPMVYLIRPDKLGPILSKHYEKLAIDIVDIFEEFGPDSYIAEQLEFIESAVNAGMDYSLSGFQKALNGTDLDFNEYFYFIKTWE